ncbi:MAG: 50S ribosomal protein L23 [Candidatus Margulisbacteria bacterium]|nr:50S ribosomal protein L23 [Candidatus Margulisiibacteriota bacterium]
MKPVILCPRITEKSAQQITADKYTFFVDPSVNKIAIQQFIESEYKVKVTKVNVSRTKPKKRRKGRLVGKTSVQKKAIVTLKKGDQIEIIKGMF